MANVKEYLKQILAARYGKDVRRSIHDSIDAINTQVTESEAAIEAAAEQAGESASNAALSATNAAASAERAEAAAEDAKQGAGANGIDFDNDTRKLSLKKGDDVLDEVEIPGGGEGGADGISFDKNTRKLSLKQGEQVLSEAEIPGGEITVDTSMSSTSTNPVQNKVVKAEIDKQMPKSGGTFTGEVTFDNGQTPQSLLNKIREKVDGDAISDKWYEHELYKVGAIVIHDNSLWECIVQNTGVRPTDIIDDDVTVCWEKTSLAKIIPTFELSGTTLTITTK